MEDNEYDAITKRLILNETDKFLQDLFTVLSSGKEFGHSFDMFVAITEVHADTIIKIEEISKEADRPKKPTEIN